MATAGENALLIAINSLVALLDAKEILTRDEFAAALTLDAEGQASDVRAILAEMARLVTPLPAAKLTAIDGGKQGDEGA